MNLVSLFHSSGYSKQTGRYMYSNYHTPRTTGRADLNNRLFIDQSEIAPVNGFPMKAKDTLLAQLLQKGIRIPQFTGKAFNYSIIEHIRCQRSEHRKQTYKPSVIQKAKRVLPLGSLLGVEIEHYASHWHEQPSTSLSNYTHDGSLEIGRAHV